MNNDRWRWYSLPDNTQEPGHTPSYRIMLLWGVFWDRAFNWLAMVLITLSVVMILDCPGINRSMLTIPLSKLLFDTNSMLEIQWLIAIRTWVGFWNKPGAWKTRTELVDNIHIFVPFVRQILINMLPIDHTLFIWDQFRVLSMFLSFNKFWMHFDQQ